MDSLERPLTAKTKAIIVQLGSPLSPKKRDVRSFLKVFLGDPRVVDFNPFLWKIILNFFILPFRPKTSAKLYSRIWEGSEFPLTRITRNFTNKLREVLGPESKLDVDHSFLICPPKFSDAWDKWESEIKNGVGAGEFLIVPMFPQYSESTVASVMDIFSQEMEKRVQIPSYKIISDFHCSKAFIDNSVIQIDKYLNSFKEAGEPADTFVMSFHGIQKRRVIYKNDAYYRHCYETFILIRDRVKGIAKENIHMTFQSRFGSEEWLEPYTEDYSIDLVKNGSKRLAFYCPSFVADCLENIDEIGNELDKELKEFGGEVKLVPCLNDDEKWCRDFAVLLEAHALGSSEDRFNCHYSLEDNQYNEMPEQVMTNPPLTTEAKSSIKIVFLTLFLDLVGFSIIFPLFPALAKHYLTVDADNVFLKAIFGSIASLTSAGGATNLESIVLFGGALGAIYSLLQFIAAPIWGVISDRIGRKPVLIVSVAGLALSYLLWFFSGSFTVLILARFIGGIMGGNISTATAVIADVTQKENRSKGMAFIGIAFAFGFIFGPAMGGLLSMVDLTTIYPSLIQYGVNPFSMPALVAFVLSCFNVLWLITKFKETLPKEKRGKGAKDRSNNPLVLFRPLPYEGINLTIFGHFLFLMAFSGMEFTLTFLAVERLGYSSMDNAYMFIFIGFIIALVQGGYVRRKANQVGERKMAFQGLIMLIPGLVCIGYTQTTWLLYIGLFFLAAGSSLVIPCLTSLVSLYTPSEYQGKSVGIFRSLGALARVFGPLIACIIYWKMGGAYPYYLGAAFLIIPIIMVKMLPEPRKLA